MPLFIRPGKRLLFPTKPKPSPTTPVRERGPLTSKPKSPSSSPERKLRRNSVTPGKLRKTASGANSAGSDTTASTSYTDLAGGAGPSVTVNVGPNGLCLVGISADIRNGSTFRSFMSFQASGANTTPSPDESRAITCPIDGSRLNTAGVFFVSGLGAGETTFTAKYKVGGDTGTFVERRIWAWPL